MEVKFKQKPVHRSEPGKDLGRERSQQGSWVGMRLAHPKKGKVSGWSRARRGVNVGVTNEVLSWDHMGPC